MRRRLVVATVVLLAGCGDADQTRAERSEAEGAPLIDISPSVNACPRFAASLILPQEVPRGSPAFIAVRAVDPDADDLTISYDWTCTSGELSAPDRATTEYRCGEAGEQVLTVVARDIADCDAELHLGVTCLSD